MYQNKMENAWCEKETFQTTQNAKSQNLLYVIVNFSYF